MWTTLGLSAKDESGFRDAATELLQATSRGLIMTIAAIYLVFVVATGIWPDQLGISVWAVVPVVLVSCCLALKLLERHFVAAQVALVGGLSAGILLGAYVAQDGYVLLLAAILPLLVSVTLGLPAALLAELGVISLVFAASRAPGMPHIPLVAAVYTVIGGAITAAIGYAATYALLTVTHWALFAFEQSRVKMDEAREQRSELKQVEAGLLEANRELARVTDRLRGMYQIAEESRRAKETFVANVSHELRTPLNMIVGFSEMIINSPSVYGANLPSALLADIATIHENSQHLAELVDDVLDLSQVEVGRMALSKEWTSLPQIIEAAALAVRPLFESKKLYLNLDVPDDLPPAFCDSTRIREVVLNLLSNAGRYTDSGGVTLAVELQGPEVVVAVSDTGPGIRPEDQSRLFRPFQQLDDSLRRRPGGTGLGLSISRRFVEMHDGDMWLESDVGAGTTFFFRIPLQTPTRVAEAQANDARRWFNPYESYESRVRTGRSKAPPLDFAPRFVVVEQERTLQRLFQRYLSEYDTARVGTIDEAITELERSPAQALILNTRPLARTDALRSRLGQLPFGTPAMTCWVPGDEEATAQLGLRRYLLKPISHEDLLGAIDVVAEELGRPIETVLLVDDEPDALRLFARMLSATGRPYRVLRAKNGARALSLLQKHRPDVVLLDLIMPGIDGFQVLEQKALDPEIAGIPVIAISSRDPSGEPIVSDRLTITRSGGLTARDLLRCVRVVSEILSPSGLSPASTAATTPPPGSIVDPARPRETAG
jgi:signal transduction histidine kinase/CheY-like chemotaxis protein